MVVEGSTIREKHDGEVLVTEQGPQPVPGLPWEDALLELHI